MFLKVNVIIYVSEILVSQSWWRCINSPACSKQEADSDDLQRTLLRQANLFVCFSVNITE